jgi:hypothetical protein
MVGILSEILHSLVWYRIYKKEVGLQPGKTSPPPV